MDTIVATEAHPAPEPMVRPARRALPLLFAIMAIDGIIVGLLLPVFPDFTASTSNPALWLGLAMVLYSLLQFLAAPVLGLASDQFGRRPVFGLAAVGTLVAMVFMLPVRLVPFLASRALDGTTNGLYGVVKSAVADVSPREQLQRNVGLMTTLSYAGMILGPATAAGVLWLATAMGWNLTRSLLVAGCVAALVNVVLSVLLPETRPQGRVQRARTSAFSALREASPQRLGRRLVALRRDQPVVARLVTTEALLYLALGYYTYIIVYVAEGPLGLDAPAIATLFVFFASLGIVANTLFFTRYVTRLPASALSIFLAIGVVVVGAYALTGDSTLALYVVVALDMVTISFCPGMIEGFIGRAVPAERRGEIFGLGQGLNALMLVISAGAYTLVSLVDLRLPFLFFAGCLAAAAVTARPSRLALGRG